MHLDLNSDRCCPSGPALRHRLLAPARRPPAASLRPELPRAQHPHRPPACHLPRTRGREQRDRKFTQGAGGLAIYSPSSSLILKSCHPKHTFPLTRAHGKNSRGLSVSAAAGTHVRGGCGGNGPEEPPAGAPSRGPSGAAEGHGFIPAPHRAAGPALRSLRAPARRKPPTSHRPEPRVRGERSLGGRPACQEPPGRTVCWFARQDGTPPGGRRASGASAEG